MKLNHDDNVTETLITQYIEELLLNIFNEVQFIDLKYLESPKFDLKNITEDRRSEYIEYMLDDRRLINKGLELLIQMGSIEMSTIKHIKKILTEIFFRTPVDPATIEVDTTNDDPGYLESIQKQKAEVQQNNERNEKLKKKIRLTAIKKEILKNKRNNVCGFISIYPDHKVNKDFTHSEMPEVDEIKSEGVEVEVKQQEEEDKECKYLLIQLNLLSEPLVTLTQPLSSRILPQ
jgi:hypothetical protein